VRARPRMIASHYSYRAPGWCTADAQRRPMLMPYGVGHNALAGQCRRRYSSTPGLEVSVCLAADTRARTQFTLHHPRDVSEARWQPCSARQLALQLVEVAACGVDAVRVP